MELKSTRGKRGEGAHPDTKFKQNSNLGMTGGVVPFQVQHGHSRPSTPKSGPAKSHSS